MKTIAELKRAVETILSTKWERRESEFIPEPEDVKLGNEAVDITGTVLYADLAESTALVDGHKDWFAAEIYKTYLMAASELIRNHGGDITAFDGDRVMAIFTGNKKNSSAARCALEINHMVSQVINRQIKVQYPTTAFEVRHAVGIDTGKLMATRTGVWGDNDLVWVGRAANYAAKLCGLRKGYYATFITSEVYERLREDVKFGGAVKQNMWTKFTWDEYGIVAYKSSWRWEPD